MKKVWKALLAAAAVASVIPYSCLEDPQTGAKSVKALRWKYPRTADKQVQITIALDLTPNALPEETGAVEGEASPEEEPIPEETEAL